MYPDETDPGCKVEDMDSHDLLVWALFYSRALVLEGLPDKNTERYAAIRLEILHRMENHNPQNEDK